MTTEEKAECERFETLINEGMERIHGKTAVFVDEIELYPCPPDCEYCEAA
jgi:hypothetical protein